MNLEKNYTWKKKTPKKPQNALWDGKKIKKIDLSLEKMNATDSSSEIKQSAWTAALRTDE